MGAVSCTVLLAGDRRTGPPRRLATLTSRELEVLGLIAQGRSNAEIGAALFLSEPTTKAHVTRILAKLQLRDRVVLVPARDGLGGWQAQAGLRAVAGHRRTAS